MVKNTLATANATANANANATATANANANATINTVTDTNTDTLECYPVIDIDTNIYHLEPFQHTLNPLKQGGWQFIKSDLNHVLIMNKKFHELEEITIEYKYNQYHFNLPIRTSIYSYYIKFTNRWDAVDYLKLYMDNLF